MAKAELSRRVEKLVGYPPLSEMSDQQRREFHEALLDADGFEDLPGKWPRRGPYMIAAGVNAKALSTYMGHANIAITIDRYGHLLPGNEEEAADLLDAYLNDRVVGQ
jgi:hypothetical protein